MVHGMHNLLYQELKRKRKWWSDAASHSYTHSTCDTIYIGAIPRIGEAVQLQERSLNCTASIPPLRNSTGDQANSRAPLEAGQLIRYLKNSGLKGALGYSIHLQLN